LSQTFLRITDRLSINQKKFIAEVAGTFIVVMLAAGSVVIDAKINGILGIPFIAFAPFIGVAIAVYLFGKISMAHFNPAVTVGFLNYETYYKNPIAILFDGGDIRSITCKPICKICNWK
jgi:aquaporin Z